jgi:hypothetical protein
MSNLNETQQSYAHIFNRFDTGNPGPLAELTYAAN